MTQIKTYRVEYEKVGTMHRVRIFGRMGKLSKVNCQKKEFSGMYLYQRVMEKWQRQWLMVLSSVLKISASRLKRNC